MLKKMPTLARIVFGKTGVVALLLIVQIAILIYLFEILIDISQYFVGVYSIISWVMIILIFNKDENTDFKLAWMIPIVAFPVGGVFFYLFVTTNFGAKTMRVRYAEILEKTKEYIKTEDSLKDDISKSELKRMFSYVENVEGFPVYKNTRVEYFSTGEAKFEKMKEELKKAEKFIFLEYFIVQEGKMWNSILEILEEKAKAGVEVRVMYDGMGTMLTLPRKYHEKLKEKGIKAMVFSPILPLLSTHQNHRDHRKILVIDGRVAFNGGVNLADEYINEIEVYGHWKDAAVMLEGDAVQSFTYMFLQMWNVWEEEEDYFKYLHSPKIEGEEGLVLPYGDSPLTVDKLGIAIYKAIIADAKDYLHIMSPYFVIDRAMVSDIVVAAKSGVDVKIVIPHIPDKAIPFDIARSYYLTLIEAGVEVYEYTPGFIHSKVFVSDDKCAVVGTINMDYRSLYHHFECATYMEKQDVIKKVEEDFQETIKVSQKVTKEYYKSIPLRKRVSGRIFRLVAPLI